MSDRDRSEPAVWGVDRASLAAMRLSRVRQAYEAEDLWTAVLEAEEILDDKPDDVEALELLGDAELDLGHGREAELIFARLRGSDERNPTYLSGLAIARFLSVDFEGALAAATAALAISPDDAEAHAYAGLSLERLGRYEEAAGHVSEAARIDPEGFPSPLAVEDVSWNGLLQRALDGLPEAFQPFYRRVPVVWHHYPDPAVLRAADPPLSPFSLALYEGTPPPEGEPRVDPRSVRAYRGNLLRFARDMARLEEDFSLALAFEAASWLGIELPLRLEAGR
ncbi:MAG: tetratricopeptide repeat protein [Deltaproteobacteria bacterium]|nr:tetratricopeptide repeat protein [Deltaproteobacteria bacterium]